MSKMPRKVASFVVRWGIAVVGIWWVILHTSIVDQALVLNAQNQPQTMTVLRQTGPGEYLLQDPKDDQTRTYAVGDLLSKPDREKVTIKEGGVQRQVTLLAMELTGDDEKSPAAKRLLVADTPDGRGRFISPSEVVGGFELGVPHPRIEIGLGRMLRQARPWLLVLAVAIFPLTIVLTSIRWRRLLAALDIQMSLWQTNVLNMVGLFYNTAVPMGSSGGDLLKAYYASKHTPYKTRAVLSVIIDRVIGLIVLIIIGSAIAGAFWLGADNRQDPAVRACGYVAVMGIVILVGTSLGLVVAFLPWVRRLGRSEMLLSRLPMRAQIEGVFDVMSIYQKRPGLILWAMAVTVPVHLNVVLAALIAGRSLGLPLTSGYYFVVVPVTVLAGAIPISPQGVGIMEFVAINMCAKQGATISEAFALTMWIRLVQMFWNLFGGIFVISGHYRAPGHDKDDETGEPAATTAEP